MGRPRVTHIVVADEDEARAAVAFDASQFPENGTTTVTTTAPAFGWTPLDVSGRQVRLQIQNVHLARRRWTLGPDLGAEGRGFESLQPYQQS